MNLLRGASKVSPGDSLLVIAETPDLGLYSIEALTTILDAAALIGVRVSVQEVREGDSLDSLSAIARAEYESSDKVLFQARLGDSVRFAPLRTNVAVSYAYTDELLGSEFCTTPHELMQYLLRRVQAKIAGASLWRLRDERGSDLRGKVDVSALDDDGEVERFPISTISPISCADAYGQIVVCPWITSTGNREYVNDSFALGAEVTVVIASGRIVEFIGERSDVVQLHSHYQRVAATFGIDAYRVHSWHCGIHPRCQYLSHPSSDIALWGRSVFGNPRYLHLHTCGSYLPGEICLSVIEPTVEFDGEPMWVQGQMQILLDEGVRNIIRDFEMDDELFVRSASIGLWSQP